MAAKLSYIVRTIQLTMGAYGDEISAGRWTISAVATAIYHEDNVHFEHDFKVSVDGKDKLYDFDWVNADRVLTRKEMGYLNALTSKMFKDTPAIISDALYSITNNKIATQSFSWKLNSLT